MLTYCLKCKKGTESVDFKCSSIHQFADEKNLLVVKNWLKQLNRKVNRDLNLTSEWVRANKLSLNANKNEIIIFKPRNKTISKHNNFWLSGQKIKSTNQVKFLGVKWQEDLHWNKYLLRIIYFSIFNSHLIYACQICGQNQNSQHFKKLSKLQEKALQIFNFRLQLLIPTIYFWELKY